MKGRGEDVECKDAWGTEQMIGSSVPSLIVTDQCFDKKKGKKRGGGEKWPRRVASEGAR